MYAARGRDRLPAKHEGFQTPGSLRHALVGEKPALPALVQCAACCRLNRVPIPEE
jgi:hypothetical protein